MDKASDFGSEDYRFESCHGHKDRLFFEGFPGGSRKNPPAMQEPQEMQV